MVTRLTIRDRRRAAANLLNLVVFASNQRISPITGIVFGKKSDKTLQAYVRLIRELSREDTSQYSFIECNDVAGLSNKYLMDDLTIKKLNIYSNGEVFCAAESSLVTTNHDLLLLFRDGELVSVSLEG